MSETVIPNPQSITRDPTDVQTFEEAIDAMRFLQEEAGASIQKIKKEGENLVITRFKQGVVVCKALDMDRSDHYGDAVVKTLAQRAGMHQSTLYRAKDFATAVPFPISGKSERALKRHVQQWMEEKAEEKGREVNWSYCRNWAKKKLRGDKETKEKQLEDNKGDLLEKADKLEREADSLEHEAREIRAQTEEEDLEAADEAEGVAYKVREVAADLRREVQGSGHIESEEYLDHVRDYQCLVCPSRDTTAYHLMEHDLFSVPLCTKHGNELSVQGPAAFEKQHEVGLWISVSYLLAEFITGIKIST